MRIVSDSPSCGRSCLRISDFLVNSTPPSCGQVKRAARSSRRHTLPKAGSPGYPVLLQPRLPHRDRLTVRTGIVNQNVGPCLQIPKSNRADTPKRLAVLPLDSRETAAGSLACGRAMASVLCGITPTDPRTYSAVLGTLLLVVLTASWIPARRAARVDPMVTLRCE
jgi:hypothetical protein